MKVLITGWAGFIGSNLVRHILQETDWEVVGMDKLTYAARPLWVYELLKFPEYAKRFTEISAQASDITNPTSCLDAVAWSAPDIVIHLAAESHVCRSIEGPSKFMETNFNGTFNLIEAVRKQAPRAVFHHVSTDEVFGVARRGTYFTESTLYDPRSPYASSKAASDHLVRAWHHTYGLNTRITNCSNNFGPNQHEEKLIPKAIECVLKGEEITVYSPGTQVRDWIHVEDHCRGILAVIAEGRAGSQYLLGGEKELSNINVIGKVWESAKQISDEDDFKTEIPKFKITNDRPTDDYRYAIDCSKAKADLSWAPLPDLFLKRLEDTVRWYRKHSL